MVYEVFSEEESALKKFLPQKIKARFTSKTIQAAGAKEPPAVLISVRTQSKIPAAWTKKLKGILTRSTGYDHLVAYRKQIACGYLGDYCARAVGEQAVLVAAALLRKLKKQIRNFDTFNRDHITGYESQGRRLLVVGVGNIGQEIVDVGRGLKMEVKGVDIKRRFRHLNYVSLEKGLAWADVAICALPLTGKTRGLLNYVTLKKAKPGLVFVNVSRGEVSPMRDLARLLKEGTLGGLGLDVFEEESEAARSLQENKRPFRQAVRAILFLKDQDDVIFTPHNAFNTHESVERKSRLSAESIRIFLAKQRFPFPLPQ